MRTPKATKPETWILTPDLESALDNPKKELGKSYYVYSPYYLLRTLEQLTPLSGTILLLPGHIRQLIELTYVKRDDTGVMRSLKQELEEKKMKLQRLANVGLSQGCKTVSDDWAPTRYSEQETCEVLIIQKIKREKDGMALTMIDGETLFFTSFPFKSQTPQRALH